MRPWVGEPGRLSPDERERFREERLRLVWSRFDCLVIFLNSELRFLLKSKIHIAGEVTSIKNEDNALLKEYISYAVTHSCPSLAPVLVLRRAILDL